MGQRIRMVRIMSLLAVLAGTLGCRGIDRMDRKIDQASEHIDTNKPVYEGRLTSAQAVGAMVSLQFADGQIYEVSQAPAALVPGDILRIYKTEKGYEAHLWKSSNEHILPAGTGNAPK